MLGYNYQLLLNNGRFLLHESFLHLNASQTLYFISLLEVPLLIKFQFLFHEFHFGLLLFYFLNPDFPLSLMRLNGHPLHLTNPLLLHGRFKVAKLCLVPFMRLPDCLNLLILLLHNFLLFFFPDSL